MWHLWVGSGWESSDIGRFSRYWGSPVSEVAVQYGVFRQAVYLGLTNTFALFRLLLMSNQDKDIEILVLRHQIAVLQ